VQQLGSKLDPEFQRGTGGECDLDACILGRIGYDLYAVEHHRPLAEVEHFSRHLGGSSANIAVGLARLGLKVGLIGCLGNDQLADFLLTFLQKEGVDTRHVQLAQGFNTSLCLTEVCPPDSFPQVFYRRDAADTQLRVGPEELSYLGHARMFITNGTSLAASPSRESTLKALRAAREAGLRTVLDVDYRASSWSSPDEAGYHARAVLSFIDVVLGNEAEILLLTGLNEVSEQMRFLADSNVHLVVRKLGSSGVEVYNNGSHFLQPPLPTSVVCAIGAGDAFAAGFLYALDRNLPVRECVRYGNAAASIVVSRVACSDAMPYRQEIEALLRAESLRATT
jgi:5-dehydro-2-deoxygluconokinase